jgi:ribonuclease P/MRP protein subunit RPP1
LHLHSAFSSGQSSIDQLAETAKSLGYAGLCFSAYFEGDSQIKKLKEEIARVKNKTDIEIFLGFEARDAKDIEKLAAKRKQFDLLLVHGGDVEVNRLAVETPEVDVLTHPEHSRNDSGLNHILMKLAAKNSVAIEINFHEISYASKNTRSKILSNMQKNVALAKKFRAPIVACSGAISHWEMKDPQVLSSFANIVGLDIADSIKTVSSVPQKILESAKERTGKNWVIPGVKIVKSGEHE